MTMDGQPEKNHPTSRSDDATGQVNKHTSSSSRTERGSMYGLSDKLVNGPAGRIVTDVLYMLIDAETMFERQFWDLGLSCQSLTLCRSPRMHKAAHCDRVPESRHRRT